MLTFIRNLEGRRMRITQIKCLRSIVFSFESSLLWPFTLVIKIVVRFQVLGRLPLGEDDSEINSTFFETNY